MDEKEREKIMERERIEGQIRTLMSSLDAPTSPVGDWKIIKIYEARLKGEEDPYDYDELSSERQRIRDEINELQAQLGDLRGE